MLHLIYSNGKIGLTDSLDPKKKWEKNTKHMRRHFAIFLAVHFDQLFPTNNKSVPCNNAIFERFNLFCRK